MMLPDVPIPDAERYRVPLWLDLLGRMAGRWPQVWTGIGDWESRRLRDRLPDRPIDRPVYVTGLARAGSTILLELLAQHPAVATHRYRDFPLPHLPWLWSRFVDTMAGGAGSDRRQPRERAHADGIRITPDSPEAFEEMLWMAFFPGLHDPAVDNVLSGDRRNADFDAFYADHLRKLLWLRGATRYVAKGNYDVTRLGYLTALFPDARFVIPIRDPVGHVASLLRQQALFSRVGTRFPRVRRHMRVAGHFEFGLDRRPVNTGDAEATRRIEALWDIGAEIEGWARYWSAIYAHVADRLDADPAIRDASLVVRFEDFCAAPAATFAAVLVHCGLAPGSLPEIAARRVHAPSYYRVPFTPEQEHTIRTLTRETARRFGYAAADAGDAGTPDDARRAGIPAGRALP